ncbi:MAG: HU family DNA-binding protein [Pseudomonadota bacterium]
MDKRQRIGILGLGTLKIKYGPPRAGCNPKSGENVPAPEMFVVSYF